MKPENVVIREMSAEDREVVLSIYEEGMATGDATFETEVPSWERWNETHLMHSRFVAIDAEVIGFAALSPTSTRAAYRGVAEVSVYVKRSEHARGVGRALLGRLIESADANGIWTLQASIFPENEASLALHERFGFRRVGTRERIGRREGRWRDVVLLERRSSRI